MRRGVALLVLLVVPGLAACGSSAPRQAEIVFVSTRGGDYAMYGVDAGGRHEWRLTKAKGDPSTPAGLFFQLEPAWSPDASAIAFASKRDGVTHIYLMRADGTDTRRLTSGADEDSRPAWSPDGRHIAFARRGEVYVAPAAGGPAHRVTQGLGGDAADPAWSPNGKWIAYDYRPAGYSIREIWIVRPDGSEQLQVTRFGQISALPTWSPKGDRIAFQSNIHGRHFEIYSSTLGGTALHRETNSSIDTIDPAWSPNGDTIAFSRDGAIWTVDRTGRATKLTSGGNDSSPAWRPVAPAAG